MWARGLGAKSHVARAIVTLNTYGHLYKEQKRDVNIRVLNAWQASLRDVRDVTRNNFLKIIGA